MANKNVPKFEDTEEILSVPKFEDTEDISSIPMAPTKTESALGGLTQGATLGFGDELAGTLSALLRPTGITNAGGTLDQIGYESPTLDLDTIKEQYNKTRDAERARFAGQKAENPLTFGASELAGGFATPAFGAAKAVGAGANTLKSAATAGAVGNVAANIGAANELENIKAKDVAIDALIGGTIGAGAYGTGKLLGKGADILSGSEVSQKMGKIFNKSKAGADLVSKEAPDVFNKQLLQTSDDIVNEVTTQANKFKNEYGKAIKDLKIDVPERFQADLDKLADDLAEQQIAGGMIDVRAVDATVNKLRDSMQISQSKIQELKNKIIEASRAKKQISSSLSYKKADKGIESVETAAENLAQKKQLDDELFQIKEDLMLLREQKRIATSASEKAEINDILGQKVKDKFYKEKELKDLGYDVSGAKLDTSKSLKQEDVVNKSSRDVLTQVDPLQAEIASLQSGNANASKQIASLIEQKQATNNSAFSGLLNQIDILKNSAPNTNLATIKDVNLNSMKSYAEQMGRPDLVNKIDDVIKSNISGSSQLDSKYRDMMAGLKEIGIGLDQSASSVIKNNDAGTYLTQQLKQAAKNETGDAANKLASTQQILGNNTVDQLLGKGKDIAENYNLSRDIAQSSLKSIGYRGAAAAGQTVGAISNSKLAKAASKLGNSSLGKKVQDVMSMPEGDVKNRALFLLGQQGWFRSVSEEDKK